MAELRSADNCPVSIPLHAITRVQIRPGYLLSLPAAVTVAAGHASRVIGRFHVCTPRVFFILFFLPDWES